MALCHTATSCFCYNLQTGRTASVGYAASYDDGDDAPTVVTNFLEDLSEQASAKAWFRSVLKSGAIAGLDAISKLYHKSLVKTLSTSLSISSQKHDQKSWVRGFRGLGFMSHSLILEARYRPLLPFRQMLEHRGVESIFFPYEQALSSSVATTLGPISKTMVHPENSQAADPPLPPPNTEFTKHTCGPGS